MGIRLPALAVALLPLVVGCPDTPCVFDFDGDGVEDSADCAPEDPNRYGSAEDPYGDGHDTNCDGADGVDSDVDGYYEWWQPGEYDFATYPAEERDCDDHGADVYPGNGC